MFKSTLVSGWVLMLEFTVQPKIALHLKFASWRIDVGESTILISVSTEASQPEPTDCINLSIFLVSGCHSLSMFIIFQYSMHGYQMKIKFHFCFTSKITTFTSHWLILSIFISYVSLGERIHINLKFAEITRKIIFSRSLFLCSRFLCLNLRIRSSFPIHLLFSIKTCHFLIIWIIIWKIIITALDTSISSGSVTFFFCESILRTSFRVFTSSKSFTFSWQYLSTSQ